MASRKRANPRFRIAAIYPSVNIQPLIKNIKIDTQHSFFIVRLNNPSRVEEEIGLCVGNLLTGLTRPMFLSVPGGRRGLDRIVVGLMTTYAISAYHH